MIGKFFGIGSTRLNISRVALLPILLIGACNTAPNQPGGTEQVPAKPPASLVAANAAIAAHMPDAAIADAQSYLRGNPYGPMAAQAWYFQGRGYEMKTAGDPNESDRNLFQARSCYLQALQQNPIPAVEGDIHVSLSNVAFFQDEYAEAIHQAAAAAEMISSNETKSFLLFRTGVSQQRLGRFTDADMTFRQVWQKYPGTAVADAARQHEGQKDFYVQLATYSSKDQAEQAVASMRANGIVISQRSDSKGNTIVDIGPFPRYADAKKVKEDFQKNFPESIIVP